MYIFKKYHLYLQQYMTEMKHTANSSLIYVKLQ